MRSLHVLLAGVALAACGRSDAPAPAAESGQGPNPALTAQERRLLAAATIALPPEGLVPESLPSPGSAGAQLMVRFCTQCHALSAPNMHGAVDWPAVARRMWVRIDMMRGELGVQSPSAADRIQLLNYLTANALPVAGNLPPGPGREVFEETCSRCHVTPDPRIHSPADWPAVVSRMERNMERMKVSGVTSQQAQQIVLYLERASRR
jgi:cytochrome c5